MNVPEAKLLGSIGRYGCLSASQLQRLHYPNARSYVMRHLAQLLAEKYLTCTGLDQHSQNLVGGRKRRIYTLTSKGRRYVLH